MGDGTMPEFSIKPFCNGIKAFANQGFGVVNIGEYGKESGKSEVMKLAVNIPVPHGKVNAGKYNAAYYVIGT